MKISQTEMNPEADPTKELFYSLNCERFILSILTSEILDLAERKLSSSGLQIIKLMLEMQTTTVGVVLGSALAERYVGKDFKAAIEEVLQDESGFIKQTNFKLETGVSYQL